MVKVHKMFCIDEDIVGFLKTVNGSALINDLLRSHIDSTDIRQMSREQLLKEKKIILIRQAAEKEVRALK